MRQVGVTLVRFATRRKREGRHRSQATQSRQLAPGEGASSDRRPAWCQTTDSVIACLENAFEHFGGVLERLVIDNLKAAVKRAIGTRVFNTAF